MVDDFIRKLFRRKRSGWISLAEYNKRHEREMKRNPSRFEHEQEQARQWSLRVARKSHTNKKVT